MAELLGQRASRLTALVMGWAGLVLLFPDAARAHSVSAVSAVTDFKSDGTYVFELAFDLVGSDTDGISPQKAVETYVTGNLTFRFDGEPARPAMKIVSDTPPPQGNDADGPRDTGVSATVAVELTGKIPRRAEQFTLEVALEAEEGAILVAGRDGKMERRAQVVFPGETSKPVDLTFRFGDAGVPPEEREAHESTGNWDTIADFVAWGFQHILPKGLDHILFILGLFFLSREFKPLLWQVTAFTVAHTVTLALAVLGHIQLPDRIVEPLIALSIVYVAIENLFHSNLTKWRPLVVFLFGLVHGLGFAGVLTEYGLPQGQVPLALISFNVGVELGQLAVIGIAWIAVAPIWKRDWYRPWVVTPCCILIAIIGLFWAWERALGPIH